MSNNEEVGLLTRIRRESQYPWIYVAHCEECDFHREIFGLYATKTIEQYALDHEKETGHEVDRWKAL